MVGATSFTPKFPKAKVMVGVATYPDHAYIRDKFITNTIELAKGHQVYLLWNGEGNPHEIFPSDWEIETIKTKPSQRGIDILLEKHKKIRRHFLKSDCTHLFMLESDNIPPTDTITRFLAHDKPIVSAVYFIRTEHKMKYIVPKELAHKYGEMAGQPVYIIKADTCPSVWGIDGNAVRMWRTEDAFPQRGLVEIFASGVGTVLIRRDVMKAVQFRIKDGDTRQFTDYMFYRDARRAGFIPYVDTDCISQHIHPVNDIGDQDKWFTADTEESLGVKPATHLFE